jgi:hypothetical protein
MRPVAGRILPKTRSSGIFRTKRSSAVSVRRFTRMLVPNPKYANHPLVLPNDYTVVRDAVRRSLDD